MATYSDYSNAISDWTAAKIPLVANGTGAGVALVRFWFDTTNVIATLDGNGKFYSDAAGTLDESSSYTFVAGALRTRYLKVTSGNSNMLIFSKNNWLRVGDGSIGVGWSSGGTNQPITTLNIDNLPYTITHLSLADNTSAIAGSITTRTNLIYLSLTGAALTIGGSITNLTSLTSISLSAKNNQVTGDFGLNNVCNGITYLQCTNGRFVDYTAGGVWSNTTGIKINPSAGYGYSSTEIDNMLIDMAASSPTGETIELRGSSAARTAASDAAKATLEGRGCTVLTN